MPNDDEDGQDHMFKFIPLKEVDRSATLNFGEIATPKVLHDMPPICLLPYTVAGGPKVTMPCVRRVFPQNSKIPNLSKE